MAGWNLTQGSLSTEVADDQSIWRSFHRLFSNRSRNQSTYKFAFIRCLLENLYSIDCDFRLSFETIFDNFARIYWNLVILHGLKQSHKAPERASIESILMEIKESFCVPDQIVYDSLDKNIRDNTQKRVKKTGKKYVVGAVYSDTKGKIYEFNLKEEFLRFNPVVHTFMKEHQSVLMKANNYEFAKFIQNVNLDMTCPNLISVLENITCREVLRGQRKQLIEFGTFECFYCSSPFTSHSNIHVDHFIPWSIIHNNQIWNLVLSCSKCNISKSDKLANNDYLTKIMNRNESMKDKAPGFNHAVTISIEELYNYALTNGLQQGWEPNRTKTTAAHINNE